MVFVAQLSNNLKKKDKKSYKVTCGNCKWLRADLDYQKHRSKVSSAKKLLVSGRHPTLNECIFHLVKWQLERKQLKWNVLGTKLNWQGMKI